MIYYRDKKKNSKNDCMYWKLILKNCNIYRVLWCLSLKGCIFYRTCSKWRPLLGNKSYLLQLFWTTTCRRDWNLGEFGSHLIGVMWLHKLAHSQYGVLLFVWYGHRVLLVDVGLCASVKRLCGKINSCIRSPSLVTSSNIMMCNGCLVFIMNMNLSSDWHPKHCEIFVEELLWGMPNRTAWCCFLHRHCRTDSSFSAQ